MPTRTPEEIRASIEDNRAQLAVSVQRLRGEIERATDWRARLAVNNCALKGDQIAQIFHAVETPQLA